MDNFNVKINLSKLKGVKKMQSQNGNEIYICIPKSANFLYNGKTGVFLNLTAIKYKDQKFEDTHYLKNEIPKDVYLKLSPEERMTPIIGTLTPFKFDDNLTTTSKNELVPCTDFKQEESNNDILNEEDDLPFDD